MNYISAKDLSLKQIFEIFSIANMLKGRSDPILAKKRPVLLLLFEKPSTRTRVSFEAAVDQLGGSSIGIDARTSQLARGETMADSARVISLYVDAVAARLYKHSDILELAANSSVPVINALTDLEHPCQALSDMYTVKEVFGKTQGLRIGFVGDIAANTANSLMVIASKLGVDMSLTGPKGYDPNSDFVEEARKFTSVTLYNDMKAGLRGCDIVYTDTFVSMGEEHEEAKRKRLFAPYQLNEQVMGYAKKDAKVMHCLPAHRGEEITSEVLDGKNSIVMRQAANKMLIEKAILLYLLNKS